MAAIGDGLGDETMVRSLSVVSRRILTKKSVVVLVISLFLTWLGIACLLAIGFGGSPFDNNPFDNADFNRSQWVADESVSDGSNRRGSMAQSIIQHHLKKGMSPQQVIALLDTPMGVGVSESSYSRADFESYLHHCRFYYSNLPDAQYQHSDQVYRYYLGEELDMAWGIDRADLCVFFQNDHYVGCRIGWPF